MRKHNVKNIVYASSSSVYGDREIDSGFAEKDRCDSPASLYAVTKRTDELMQSLAMEKFQVYASRPDVFNLNAAATKLSQAWGDDPDEMVLAKKQQQPMPGTEAPSEAPGGQSLMNQLQGGPTQKLGLPVQGAPQLA